MPTPFSGMDPYLEQANLWPQVHTALVVSLQWYLVPLLRPQYHVAIEQMTYLSISPPPDSIGRPDALVLAADSSPTVASHNLIMTSKLTNGLKPASVTLPMPEEIKQRHLVIRDVAMGTVITVIEVLSPHNKVGQKGRMQYGQKRLQILGSRPTHGVGAHLVEIDLLRTGSPLPATPIRQNAYSLLISRSQNRPQADIYAFSLRDTIPDLPIPLHPMTSEPVLPLNKIVHDLYDQGGYDLIIDYDQPPEPRLPKADAAWARQLLQSC